ncbi:MAG: glycosyltransferase family 4 protein [Chitinophagaceae bacterium]|nr:glycosyltransferase family 4 protein [Chitinophagaceae bacterium]
MKIAFVTRSTLYKAPGGDTIQVLQTAKALRRLGVDVDVCLAGDRIDYEEYDVLHFTNITRPADILYHTRKTKKPFVVSPILVEYHEYDRRHRQGLSGLLLSRLSAQGGEYAKTFGRWIARKDKMTSLTYLWKGQRKSIRQILEKAAMILPNSESEYQRLQETYGVKKAYMVVPNGIDTRMFFPDQDGVRDSSLVLCAARIEGIKNQLNLIKAMNGTHYTLLLVGSAAPNQQNYYKACRDIAGPNIVFREHVPQEVLVSYYRAAKVHALPSWFETCGLSSLEAAAMGCNVAISEKGYTREYFGDEAFYCDPGNPQSIYETIDRAARSDCHTGLQEKVIDQYSWERAAEITLQAYNKITGA